jgi:predicted nucleotidyltransferase component of viral defense system
MKHSSRELKDLVRKLSGGDSAKTQIILRYYAMQRFLERLSLSSYHDNMILKGGLLISSMLGINNRSTMDIDTTVKGIELAKARLYKIIEEILAIKLDDGMVFTINNFYNIMEESAYHGIRAMLTATLETMRIPLKIDFSTGDAITPKAVPYSLELLFEARSISLLAYNLETVLAEKIETLLSRGTANTRMRDFYDIYALDAVHASNISPLLLGNAVANTAEKRGSLPVLANWQLTLDEVSQSPDMQALWKNYQRKFAYADNIPWHDVMTVAKHLCTVACPK